MTCLLGLLIFGSIGNYLLLLFFFLFFLEDWLFITAGGGLLNKSCDWTLVTMSITTLNILSFLLQLIGWYLLFSFIIGLIIFFCNTTQHTCSTEKLRFYTCCALVLFVVHVSIYLVLSYKIESLWVARRVCPSTKVQWLLVDFQSVPSTWHQACAILVPICCENLCMLPYRNDHALLCWGPLYYLIFFIS